MSKEQFDENKVVKLFETFLPTFFMQLSTPEQAYFISLLQIVLEKQMRPGENFMEHQRLALEGAKKYGFGRIMSEI